MVSVMETPYFYAILFFLFVFIIIAKTGMISKAIDSFFSSSFWQGKFAKFINYQTQMGGKGSPLEELNNNTFAQISEKVEELGGDVLEIGAGAGSSLASLRLPKGSSLVVVDYNPHFEKYFRATLSKHPDIQLKDYFVQSAADMSNIPDNSFAVVFVVDVLCSIDEDLLRKMLQEVKRVLKPVSSLATSRKSCQKNIY